MKSPMWTFGMPPDAGAWLALALGCLCVGGVWWRGTAWLDAWLQRPRVVLFAALSLGVVASLLSALYVTRFLGGAPRIIDATSYFLEARMLSEGSLSVAPLDPAASFRGRFLTGPTGSNGLGVIFPPGYPLLLAAGFLLGHPMWVGPLLALALVLLSYGLALRLFGRRDVALLAATLSALSAALRYHTADTMSHGWAALLLGLSLYTCTFRRPGLTLLGGLAAGLLLATRPLTGALALALAATWLFRDQRRQIAALVVGTVPGIALLFAHQHALTGSWFSSTQLHYYALADGPPGCFAYGFGAEVGCRHEHAAFVAERLAGGFGPLEALRTTVHRVHWHMLDLANFEPLWMLMVYAGVVGIKDRRVRMLVLAPIGITLVYLPFYFNGSYPGGGARFLIDTIVLEHVLLAWGALKVKLARWVLPMALVGYATHSVHAHHALSEREGGRPMFEPQRLAALDQGLVLVSSDHGFNLGYDPARRDARRGVVVARYRGDAHDTVLHRLLGEPNTFHYEFEFWKTDAAAKLRRLDMERRADVLRFEAESTWPPLKVTGGWVEPKYLGDSCVSKGRGLNLNPSVGEALDVDFDVHALEVGRYDLVVGWVRRSAETARLRVGIGPRRVEREIEPTGSACGTLELPDLPLLPGQHRLTAVLRGAPINLDYAELRLRDSSTTVKGVSGGNSVDN